MTSLPKLVFSIILILVLIQSGHAKTSTENLIVNESDILGLKKPIEIEEGDFVEDVQVNSDDFVWIVNLKNGPFPTPEKAKQTALALKKTLGLTLTGLLKEISIVQELKSPKNKNFNQTEFSWTVNFRLGAYNSKDKALQIVQKLKITQKFPENVFLTRESSNVKTSKFAENIQTEVSGEIFLTREVPTKDKTEHFILIMTKSNSLNVRKYPSSSSPVVASLLKGSKVPHIEKNAPRYRNRNWFYVEYSKGKFGWISSSYSKKIIDSDSRISQQTNLKTIIPEKLLIGKAPTTSQFRKLKSVVALLRTELDKIKSDKTGAIEARNRARAKLEVSITTSNKKIRDLQTTTASLRTELDKIKSDKTRAIEDAHKANVRALETARRTNAKAKEEKLASIKEFKSLKEKSSAEIKDLQTTTASLRAELNEIKSDQAMASEVTRQVTANAKKEKLASANEKNTLKEKINTLRVVLDKFKIDKDKTIQANARAKEEKLASIKEFESLKEKSSAEIKGLQTTTTSLRSELDKIKSEKARAIVEATNQANAKAKEEKLASIKEFESLKEKSSAEIKGLQTTTTSLRSELDKIKSDKTVVIEAARKANARAKEEKLASIKELNNLKEKSSTEIKALQTTTASLRSKLDEIKSNQSAAILKDLQAATASLRSGRDKMRSEKIRAVEATRQANAKAKKENLASIKEFESLKEKSSAEIMGLQTTTASLRAELDQIKSDRARVIAANAKAHEEKLASIKEFDNLKEKSTKEITGLQTTTASLRSELGQIKSDRGRVIAANAKANEEKLASIKEFESLKEKSSVEIKDLQATTTSLRSELDKIKSNQAMATEVTRQATAKAKEEKLASANEKNALKAKINTLRVVLDKFKIDKDKTIQANAKTKAEKLASIKEFKSLKEKSSAEIKDLQTTTASLLSELDKISSEKARAIIEAANQANAKAKEEKLASIKEFKSLKEKSSAKIKDLQATTASLRSELDKIKSDKARAITATDQASAKLQDEKLANAKLIASLKAENKKEIDDLKLITASLQKELQTTKVDEAKSIEAANQANAKIRAENLRNIEFKNKLKDTVIFLRKELDQVKSDKTRATKTTNQTHAKLNAEKLANSNKINRLKKTSDREIKNLNATIKTLRTVLGKFKTEKQKTVETRKSLERKIETERMLSAKKINTFKNESTALKLQLDKAHLDRIKAIEAINRNDRETQTGQLARENEFNTFKQESAIEIANLEGVTESLRRQLTQLKAEKTRSTQTETLLSSSKNLQEPTDSKRIKRKNKHRATSDTLPKNESDNQGDRTLSPTDIVTSHLFNWAKAWESRNIPRYLSFYSKRFKDPKRSRSKWETYRRRSLKNTLNISIELSNIKAFIYRKNSIKVTFIQSFKSNKLSDIGIKELFWKKDANGWKIIKETWRPQLTQLKAEKTRSTQTKTLLSSSQKSQKPTIPEKSKPKNKPGAISDTLPKNESDREKLAQLKAEKTRSTQTKTLLSSSQKSQKPTTPEKAKPKNKPGAISDTLPKNESDNQSDIPLSSTDIIASQDIITSHLFNWVDAWQSRNIPLYLSFYSKNFKDPKRSRLKWEAYRRHSLENTLNIYVEISNIKTYISKKSSIRVTFIQRFKSNKLSDIGIKELIWKEDANGWKIVKETWRPR